MEGRPLRVSGGGRGEARQEEVRNRGRGRKGVGQVLAARGGEERGGMGALRQNKRVRETTLRAQETSVGSRERML